MNIELKQLSLTDGRDVFDMLQDIEAYEYGFTNDVKGMTYSDFLDWIKIQDDYSKGRNLPDNWIAQTTFILYAGETPVGIGRVRHQSSEYLERNGCGNLGYGIAKSYRNKGYGNMIFEKLLEQCKKLGYSEIKLFPYINNVATNKVMLKYGARLIGTLNNEKNIYEIRIK